MRTFHMVFETTLTIVNFVAPSDWAVERFYIHVRSCMLGQVTLCQESFLTMHAGEGSDVKLVVRHRTYVFEKVDSDI